MITGIVTADREATVPLSVCDASGKEQTFEAIIDTGFNGSLTLPSTAIATLGLGWRSRGRAILANGSEEEFDIYVATVVWDGHPRTILVEAADTDPLIGMSLLYGYDLHIQAIDGGSVRLQRL